jgi:hypothetical protein
VNCTDLDHWLDQGSPAESHLEAMAHARICARCQTALRVADELETRLGLAPLPAPDGLVEQVMAQVATTAQAPARIPLSELLPFFQAQPWWVRMALEPAAVLAILLAAVLTWRGEILFALASGGAVQLAAWIAQTFPVSGTAVLAPMARAETPIWLHPAVLTSTVLAAAPLALMASRLLYRWSESLVGPRHIRPRAR